MPSNNDNEKELFQPMKTQTTAHVASDGVCLKRKVLLGYPQLIILCAVAMCFGVGLSIEYHKMTGNNLRAAPQQQQSLVSEANTLLAGDPELEEEEEFAVKDITAKTDDEKKEKHHSHNKDGEKKLIWLMSFPNSGTSFTGQVVKELTKRNTATNYGSGNTDENGNSISVFPESHKEWKQGPFWVDPHKHTLRDYPQPDEYILTKTHCGGRCEYCAPERYIENIHSFKYQCLGGKRRHKDPKTGKSEDDITQYSIDLVKKAIHLIRNPFDNIVSRYHLEAHEFKKINNTEGVTEYDGSKKGFREFCHDLDDHFRELESHNRIWDKDIRAKLGTTPCRADFFRWVQWHNLATVLTGDLGIPTYVLHYENYETRYNDTLTELVDFMEQEQRGPRVNFIKGKEYTEFFHIKEQIAVKNFVKEMALSRTWEVIGHYFDGIPDELDAKNEE